MPERVLICGSRDWTDQDIIRRWFREQSFAPGTEFIHGDNGYGPGGPMLFDRPDADAVRGADKLAGAVAEELGFTVHRYPADWRTHRNTAGPIRNSRMLSEGKPDQVIAFTDDLANSRGTRDMCRKAVAAGLPVRVIGHAGERTGEEALGAKP